MLKSIVKDSLVYGLTDACFKVLGLLTFPIYAHVFSVDQYGIIALSVTITALLSIFHVGVHNAVQRFYWEEEDKQRIVVSTGLIFLTLLAMLCAVSTIAVAAPLSERILQRYSLEWSYLVIAALTIIPSQACIFCECILRLHFAPWKFTLISALHNLSNVILSLTLVVYFKLGVMGSLLGIFLSGSLVLPLALFLIRKDLTLAFDLQIVSKIVRFGAPFILTGTAYWIFGSMDRWMLGELSDLHEVGLYSVAFKLCIILALVKSAFGQAWSPHAFKIYEKEPGYRVLYSRVLSLWFAFLIVVGACLSFFAPEFFALTTPPEYWAARGIVILGIGGTVFYGSSEVTAIGISLKQRPILLTQGAWLAAGVNLVFNYLWIPHFGAVGAAAATCLSYGVLSAYFLYHSQRLHPIPLELPQLFASLVLLLASMATAWVAKDWPMTLPYFFLKLGIVSSLALSCLAIHWKNLRLAAATSY